MALIENLERDDWERTLRSFFGYTLKILKEDRFRSVGSSVDDLRAWILAGGLARVRYHLANQMEMRRFPPARKAEINQCLEQLVDEHRAALLDLMASGTIPGSAKECLAACGFSEEEFVELLDRLVRGERPFEEWMYQHGYSAEDIRRVYDTIDRSLLQSVGVPQRFAPPDVN